MTVQVINKDGKELMPCSKAIARLLLKQGKATVKHKKPFTIKLSYLATSYLQALPGSCVQNKLTRKNFMKEKVEKSNQEIAAEIKKYILNGYSVTRMCNLITLIDEPLDTDNYFLSEIKVNQHQRRELGDSICSFITGSIGDHIRNWSVKTILSQREFYNCSFLRDDNDEIGDNVNFVVRSTEVTKRTPGDLRSFFSGAIDNAYYFVDVLRKPDNPLCRGYLSVNTSDDDLVVKFYIYSNVEYERIKLSDYLNKLLGKCRKDDFLRCGIFEILYNKTRSDLSSFAIARIPLHNKHVDVKEKIDDYTEDDANVIVSTLKNLVIKSIYDNREKYQYFIDEHADRDYCKSVDFGKCRLFKLSENFDVEDTKKYVESFRQKRMDICVIYGYAKGDQYALLVDKFYFVKNKMCSLILDFKTDDLCQGGDSIYILENMEKLKSNDRPGLGYINLSLIGC